ncbi:hypothetical protein [Streptomyces cyanogenus]|uniref:Uncharacterized protein n=1 Tax=Streptomyces cyanogenus TaxID=80860 RepID=A0ABX7TYU7_STRCY|nr:hypothetical protein [Streptomyces cyanogenus]QTE01948.1 hypothetical protein S1361_31745 [Streptomyces cyanogenus]
MGQPRMNEERFYLYPMKRVAAVLDNKERYTAACHQLEQAGINLSRVNVLKGPEGQRLLDSKGTSHGLYGRFMRGLQHGGYEGETVAAHSAALSQGKWLIFVPVRGKDEARRTVDILRSHGGSDIFHFRRWAVQFFPPTYRLMP